MIVAILREEDKAKILEQKWVCSYAIRPLIFMKIKVAKSGYLRKSSPSVYTKLLQASALSHNINTAPNCYVCPTCTTGEMANEIRSRSFQFSEEEENVQFTVSTLIVLYMLLSLILESLQLLSRQ